MAGHAMSSSQVIKTGLRPATDPVPDQLDVFSSSLCEKAKPPRRQVWLIRRVRARLGKCPVPTEAKTGRTQ